MITKSTVSALRALIHLSRVDPHVAVPPRRIAEALGESPSYLAKVMRHLVKSGILQAGRGAKGGLRMNQPPSRITLLAVVESCQGTIHGDYCNASCRDISFCRFHEATLELHRAVCGILSRWTLADLLERPATVKAVNGRILCFMARGSHAAALPCDLPVPRNRRSGGRHK